ncbi:citrate synthase [Pseudorhodoferax sp.]|uniref:citrate synthase n=1 Tax=Pseudorhodoferax sp. TaxID=1993553 RepID=UPI002DD68651|nr:citrate synthase [Pseudorhodoferax sp.]
MASTGSSAQQREELIDAKAAMALLGIKPQTLYAYVSRGLIRAVNNPGSKASLYYRQDLDALRLRGRTREAARGTAERSLRVGGDAVLQTTITGITPQGPLYRGLLATDLALHGRPFESVVELLCTGTLPARSIPWAVLAPPEPFASFARAIAATAPSNNPRRIFALAIESLASCQGANAELHAGAAILAARQIIQVMTAAAGTLRERPAFEIPRAGETLAALLTRAIGAPADGPVAEVVNTALIVCADHELAPSTFAARIAASAGADLYSCIGSALGAFEGLQTGLGCDLAEALLRECSSPARYAEALRAVAERKQPLPGYNHALYPEGDPRAAFLFDLVRRAGPAAPRGAFVLGCIKAARDKLNASPGLSVAMAAVAVAFDLVPRSAGALMAIGRTAGWVAHAFEQRMAGFLVRPRAEYVGPQVSRPL